VREVDEKANSIDYFFNLFIDPLQSSDIAVGSYCPPSDRTHQTSITIERGDSRGFIVKSMQQDNGQYFKKCQTRKR
jgi:hypothetical protein